MHSPSSKKPSSERKIIVILTVNQHETDAVLDAFLQGGAHEQQDIGDLVFDQLGSHGEYDVLHTTCEMGSGGIGAAQGRTRDIIERIKPHSVLAVGIAFGVDPDKQKIGDVLVSKQLEGYELQRVGEGITGITLRGDRVSGSATWLNRVRAADNKHRRGFAHWPAVHIGLILSGEKLIDSKTFRDNLIKATGGEAKGGEMEGAGLYTAASSAPRKTEWLVIKAICDWANEKGDNKDNRQRFAARNAARLAKAAIDPGGSLLACLPLEGEPATARIEIPPSSAPSSAPTETAVTAPGQSHSAPGRPNATGSAEADADAEAEADANPAPQQPSAAQRFYTLGRQPNPNFHDPLNHLATLRAELVRHGTTALTQGSQASQSSQASQASQSAHALHGMGGVGKTTLALQYSYTFCADYACVRWFLADETGNLELGFTAFAQENNIPINPGQSMAQPVKAWLATQARCLLVFDNAEDPQVLKPYLPDRGGHHVLITSRRRDWQGIAGARQCIGLGHWSAAQGAEFLAIHLPDQAPQDLATLAQSLGGLPLALAQAAGFMLSHAVSAREYGGLLADPAQRAAILAQSGNDDERSVLHTLSLSLPRLTPAARQLIDLCARCAPEPIPESLFQAHGDLLPEALKAASTDLAWIAMRKELLDHALLERDTARQTLALHRLTCVAVRFCDAKPEATEMTLLGLLLAGFPEDTKLPTHWPRCAALLPHVKALVPDVGNREQTAMVCRLLNLAARYLRYGPARYAEAVQLLQTALAHRVGEQDGDAADVLDLKADLAILFDAQGDLAGAQQLGGQVLAARQRVLGLEHPATLRSMNDFAGTLRAQGDLAGARHLHAQVFDAHKRVLGLEHPDTRGSMNNLAETLSAQGDLAGARHLQEQVCDANKRVLGLEHPDTLTSMNNLAKTHRAQGHLASARDLLEQVFDAEKRVLGLEHPNTLASMNNLAVTLNAQGDLAGAQKLQAQALAAQTCVLGLEHPDTTHSAWNLFHTLRQLGKRRAAQDLASTHLHWLLKRKPNSLGADQKLIRAMLAQMQGK